ncbi:uncharacterized protein LOC128298347 [Anopheles moucheti]|uniref:uncharacterized protein LOC128298347 n=1 Tax=Anopheles moucheti TaxID=186751 RepID=UPI0022EFFE0F|nr:uncharacterized protein LOC128298347 [Anopheles moucheti]
MQNPAYSDAKFIELIKRQPAVWCKDDSLYNNRIADKTIWKEISNLLETDVHVLKKKWHALRGQYRREIRLYAGKSKWKHFKRLSFLAESYKLPESPFGSQNFVEGDPISIQVPPLDTSIEHNEPMKEETCDWSCNTSVSPRVEKITPKVPVVDISNESNYYFALSLVGILNSVPKGNELAARIAILNVLKDFQPAHREDVQGV